MTTLTPQGFTLKNVDLLFGADVDNYGAHASTVRFDPSSSQVTFNGMAPGGQLTDTTEPTWTVTVAYVQDWDSPKSLSRFLYQKAGEQLTVKFKPKAGVGEPSFTATVTIAHGPIGGDSGAFPVGSVTMGCTKPVLDSDDAPGTVEPAYPA